MDEPSVHITLVNHDILALLIRNGNHGAILVHVEVARIIPTRLCELHKRQLAVWRGLERDNRVTGQFGAVSCIRVVDGENSAVAVRSHDKRVAGRQGDFRSKCLGRDGKVAVGADFVDLGEVQAGRLREIVDLVAHNLVAELVHDKQIGGAGGAGRPEDGVARAVAFC